MEICAYQRQKANSKALKEPKLYKNHFFYLFSYIPLMARLEMMTQHSMPS